MDVALGLVADARRRRVLRYLIEGGERAVTVGELVDAATAGAPGPADSPVQSTAERVAVELRHNHLPKLDEAGIVEYDPRSGTVRYRRSDRMEELVAFVSERLE